jgi:predicted Zn-dependent protease
MAIVAKTPNSPVANINAANVTMRRGELERAERHLAKAGTSADADYARALYALHMGNYSEAKHLLKRVGTKVSHAATRLDELTKAGY